MEIPSSTELGEARAAFDADWGGVDEVLYDLCRRFPGHSNRRAVMAKVALIGRAYQAGLERCISPPPGEQAVVVAGDHLFRHARDADEIVDALNGIREPLTAPAMCRIVELHGQLTSLLRGAQPRARAPRSFVSKYLHFHNPAVPIYDSYAAIALGKRVPWRGGPAPFERPSGSDAEYCGYCSRLFGLYVACHEGGVPATVKALDAWLWKVPERAAG